MSSGTLWRAEVCREAQPLYAATRLMGLEVQLGTDQGRIGLEVEVEILGTAAVVKGPHYGLGFFPFGKPGADHADQVCSAVS